jgi:hypothetical protein
MSYKNKSTYADKIYGNGAGTSPKNSAAPQAKKAKTDGPQLQLQQPSTLPLGRKNFVIMIASAALIVIGFLLMLGGTSTTTEFNPDIFSARRVVVGPTIAFIGFVAMAVAIIYLPRKRKADIAQQQQSAPSVSDSDTQVEPGAIASK